MVFYAGAASAEAVLDRCQVRQAKTADADRFVPEKIISAN
jgi:hypothetical protein